MNPDAMALLRDANPAPTPTTWSEDEIRDAVAAIVTGSAVPDTRPRRRWAVPALAAAAVVAVAVGVVAVGGSDRSAPAAGSGPVTCQVSTDGGRARTADRLATAKSVIDLRAKASGSRGQSFELDAGAGTIVVRARGIDADVVSAACRTTTTAIRPLVVAGVPVDTSAPTSTTPLRDLGFPVPQDAARAAALTAAQRARLATALSHTSCASLPTAADDGAVVRCGTTDSTSLAYLLGPPLAADDGVTDARAVQPSAGVGGSSMWTVALSLDAAAGTRIGAFTTAHNVQGRSGNGPTTCASGTQPSCADYLAFEVDGRVLQAPLTAEPIVTTDLVVSGAFTDSAAEGLAADYRAASIGLRLR